MKSPARVSLLLAILAAYALRVLRLGAQELRGDEAFGYFFSLNPYTQIVTDTLKLEEPHPVLSYFVQRAWMAAAGESEFALRYIGVVFSVAAVALLFRLMRTMDLPIEVSVAGSLLMAVSPYAVWHAQDARMYSMSLALTLASTLLGMLYLRRVGPALGAGYVAVSLAALHTHYFAAFAVLSQNLYVVSQVASRRFSARTLRRWITWQAILWALYLPWLWTARNILSGYGGNGDSPGPLEAVGRALAFFAAGESVPEWQGPVWAALGLIAASLGLLALASFPRYRPGAWLFGLYLGVPVLAAWFGAQARPIFDERYLAAAAPPFFALAASALVPLIHRLDGSAGPAFTKLLGWAGVLTVSALMIGAGLSLTGYYSDPLYSKSRGWRELADALERLSACLPADSVRLAQNYPDPTLWYYFDGEADHLVLPPLANDAILARDEVEMLAEDGVQRVLLIEQPDPSWDASGIAQSELEHRFVPVAVDRSTNWPISVFTRSLDVGEDTSVQFANGLRLAGHALHTDRVVPGGVVVVDLAWDLDEVAELEPVKVFVQLIDSEGLLIAQRDQLLTLTGSGSDGANGTESYGILVPRALPPGDYRMIAGLYLPESGAERVPTEDGSDHVQLGSVTVWAGDASECAD